MHRIPAKAFVSAKNKSPWPVSRWSATRRDPGRVTSVSCVADHSSIPATCGRPAVMPVSGTVELVSPSPGRKVFETEPGRNNPDCGIARSGCGSQRMDQSDVAGWSTGDPEHSLLSDRNQSCCTWRQQSGRADVRLCLSSSDAAAVRVARSVLCAVTG